MDVPGQRLAILAVQEFAHRLPPRLIRFTRSFALVCVHAAWRRGGSLCGGAAFWAAVCKAWLVRLQFELFCADGADFNGESHLRFMIRRPYRAKEVCTKGDKRLCLFVGRLFGVAAATANWKRRIFCEPRVSERKLALQKHRSAVGFDDPGVQAIST